MIYGLIPVGGYGSRLNLPFPKEMLPLKNYNFYYPVCKLTVDNMISAGCEKIFFIHGKEYKKEIVSFFNDKCYSHIKNLSPRQSEVFSSFYKSVSLNKDDIFYYGLPDTYYKKNLFLELKKIDGLACGMFAVDNNSVVGRLNTSINKFEKSVKKDNLTKYCWGVLKFDLQTLQIFNKTIEEKKNSEAEELINENEFKVVYGDEYYDLGTWDSLNKYWNL